MFEKPAIPRLAVTAGEPAGIGPELCLMLAHQTLPAQVIVIADPELLAQRAALLNLDITIILYDPADRLPAPKGSLLVAPVFMARSSTPGRVDTENSRYVLDTLKRAATGCQQNEFDAMITAPVHKEVINNAGIAFSGHTEFLAELTDTPEVVMMLATEGLRVALATTHLPLSEVPAAITSGSLEAVIRILHHDLKHKFSIEQPHIFVCGLNPHAGEGGHLGMEEIETIIPVLKKCQADGMKLTGPLAADTLFNTANLEKADAVLAMYHDQGLPVLKFKGFGKAVNVTLGLPIIRTSVDHGTALDLAGTGKANPNSLFTAIEYALNMI